MASHQKSNVENLRSVFNKYASLNINGQLFMTPKDFVIKYLRLFDEENYNVSSVNCVASAADTTKDGLISFEEFLAFEALLCTCDSLYSWAFELFNHDGHGAISFDNFKKTLDLTSVNKEFPFNFDCDFIKLHFSKDKSRKINYNEFTQIIHDFNDEHAIQAFKQMDKDNSGTITVHQFISIIIQLKSHLLTQLIKENLLTVALHGETDGRISFAYYMAFVTLLTNIELIKKVYLSRTHGNTKRELTKEEMLNEAQHFSQITPMEMDILFQLTSLLRKDGRVTYQDLCAITPVENDLLLYHTQSRLHGKSESNISLPHGRSVFMSILEQCYRFTLGSIAGAFGATAVYPIDLVKTRMQNQRATSTIGELMYKSSWDCFRKVIRFEGFFGLYRGLGPQILGVAPEKAIKLTVNDLVRDQFTKPDGDISLYAEILSGSCAGASQVMFTNPLEIVKIRLQVAGEIASTKRLSAFSVIKELGFFGLYKGSRACFLRDIPFSAIYFTAYNHLKKYFADENGCNSSTSLLMAATISGVPAAFLATPADVIKTRLQVVARTGQTTYTGVIDAAKKIWHEEGGRAFWKGSGARVFRSSPQFGVTLLSYETLQRYLNLDFGGRELSGKLTNRQTQSLSTCPDHIGGYQYATTTFCGIESRLGLCFPKYVLS
ncbi:Calcium-binding mitochondrial carrier protein Aralar1 [Schistosoma japonicum]|nr:Calcium-binding mitochondrial carrier protein Aralar1 [Schistosoma japonicum]